MGGAGRREAKRGRETEVSSNDLWSFNAMHLFKFSPRGFHVHTNTCLSFKNFWYSIFMVC